MVPKFPKHKNIFSISLFFVAFFLCASLQARVFNLSNETIAPFLRVNYGTSQFTNQIFVNSLGADTNVDKDFASILQGGELGLIITGPRLGFRLGVEILTPANINTNATSNAGAELYQFESGLTAITPRVGLDYAFRYTSTWKTGVAVTGGLSSISYKNSYTLNAAGEAAFPGITSFSEEGSATATQLEAALFFETLMNDTTTISLDLGYRSLNVTSFKYKEDFIDLAGTAKAKNDLASDADVLKAANLSGVFLALTFRFYLGK